MTRCLMTNTEALIIKGKYCWAIDAQRPTVLIEAFAKDMSHIHKDPSLEQFEIKDEYPFPKIQERFKQKIIASLPKNVAVQLTGSVAIIYAGNKAYVIDSENLGKVQDEPRPHMHNAHHSPFLEEFEIEDEYPYPKVAELLREKATHTNLYLMLMLCFSTNGVLEHQQEAARLTSGLVDSKYGEKSLANIRKVFMEQPMSEELEFDPRVITLMHPKLQDIFKEAHLHHRGTELKLS